jgi:hypothetical protein
MVAHGYAECACGVWVMLLHHSHTGVNRIYYGSHKFGRILWTWLVASEWMGSDTLLEIAQYAQWPLCSSCNIPEAHDENVPEARFIRHALLGRTFPRTGTTSWRRWEHSASVQFPQHATCFFDSQHDRKCPRPMRRRRTLIKRLHKTLVGWWL